MSELLRALPLWARLDRGEDPTSPMAWITGPRQVGKTWLVRKLDAAYFNWDTPEVRKAYLADPYFFRGDSRLVIFDEIHKRRDWKGILKGLYDSPTRRENFVVTGSGRMDRYLRGGDSLAGRYDLFHLFPVTWDEFRCSFGSACPALSAPRSWDRFEPATQRVTDQSLIRLGGFPKPLMRGEDTFLRRWQDQYLDRIVREDVRDLSAVQRIDELDLLARILPERIGSPISFRSLAEDLEVSPVAVRSWLRLFEVLYFGFRISPFHRKIHRAVKREPKWYFFQWTYAAEPGARFENYIAVQLLAACSAWTEQGFGRYELFYLRDQDRREIDFVICRDLKALVLIEAKSAYHDWPSALSYYSAKLEIPGVLVYPGTDREDRVRRVGVNGWILPSHRFLSTLLIGAPPPEPSPPLSDPT